MCWRLVGAADGAVGNIVLILAVMKHSYYRATSIMRKPKEVSNVVPQSSLH